MSGHQLKVVAKHASDAKEPVPSSTAVYARQGKPDPLRRTFLEREFQKHRVQRVWRTLVVTAAETAAQKKAAEEKAHERAVQKAKAQSGAAMPSEADEKDHPFWDPHLPNASPPWPESDVAAMKEMKEERLAGIAMALLLMDNSSALSCVALYPKRLRLWLALPERKPKTETAAASAATGTMPTDLTDLSLARVYGYEVPAFWERTSDYRKKLIPASKKDYGAVHPQNLWTETLVEAMNQLKTLFGLSLSADDRAHLLERTLIQQGKSVPSSVAVLLEEFLCKRVAKKTLGNTRLAAAGLMVALWHSELERAFDSPVSYLNMIA